MAVKNSEITKSDVLPYDFVKENEVVSSKIDNGYLEYISWNSKIHRF